jgi:hypothetical protein
MMSKWPKLRAVILLGCLSSIAVADTNYETASPFWQKEFGYEGSSCFPQLLNAGDNEKIVIVGSMFNQRDRNSIGRIWQWTLDKKTGDRLSDITLKSAKSKDSSAISSFWITKGVGVMDDNETLLFIEPMERGGIQSLIKNKNGRTVQSHEIKTQVTKSGFFAGRMKRINSEEYFLFGSERRGQDGVIQKRNNNGDVIWERLYQYGEGRSCVADISQSRSSGLVAIAGWTENKSEKGGSVWVNIIDDSGTVIAREVFDVNAIDRIRVPQVAVLDNNNIAIVYNMATEGQLTNTEYRIYSDNLKLKLKDSVCVCKMDFLYYGMATIDGGFVIVYDVLELGVQYEILNQYDCDGKKIRAIKIDGVGVLGDQVIVGSKGKMVYLASLKTPPLPPVRTVVTALKLK